MDKWPRDVVNAPRSSHHVVDTRRRVALWLVQSLPACALITLLVLGARAIVGPLDSVASETSVPALPLELQQSGGPAVRGNATAPVGIIEYSDFECPFCRRFALEVLPQLDASYISKGTVAFEYRHMPLPSHPAAVDAALAAVCAAQQEKFWPMHDRLFASPSTLSRPEVRSMATSLGLEDGFLDTCLEGSAKQQVSRDMEHATRLGVRSTPTFLIGAREEKGLRVAGIIVGARSFADFAKLIDPLLRR